MARRRRSRKKSETDPVVTIIVITAVLLVVSPQFRSLVVVALFIGGIFWLLAFAIKAMFGNHSQIQKNPNNYDLDSSLLSKRKYNKFQHKGLLDKEFENRVNKTPDTNNLRPTGWSLELINSLDWKVFEDLCAAYFKAKGHKAQVTNLGADGGVDVLLFGQSDPDAVIAVVQCKAWFKKQIGVKEIRELFGIMADRNCPMGIYITTSGYTAEAKAFAENKRIELKDSQEIYNLIKKLPDESQQNLFSEIVTIDYNIPSCPNCGTKLVVRTSKKPGSAGYQFWGCKNFPRCRYKMKIRKAA